MPTTINHQPSLKPTSHLPFLVASIPTRHRPNQRLAHHLRQKHRQGVIIPETGDLNRHLHPRPLPRSRIRRPRSSALALTPILPIPRIPSSRDVLLLRLLREAPQIQRVRGRPANRLLDLRFHADDGLRAVCEPDARAAVRPR